MAQRPFSITTWVTLFLAQCDSSFSRINSCKKEPQTINWLRSFVKEGDVFYDVGANTGSYSFVAASLVHNIKVFSFEPVPGTFMELCENIKLNNLDSVVFPMNIALSDKDGITDFKLSNFQAGAAMHVGISDKKMITHVDSAVFSYPIITKTIKSIVDEFGIPFPNLMKIDVDGPEFNIIQGAEQILKRNDFRTLQVEFDIVNQPVDEIISFLKECNLTLYKKNQHHNPNISDYVFIKHTA